MSPKRCGCWRRSRKGASPGPAARRQGGGFSCGGGGWTRPRATSRPVPASPCAGMAGFSGPPCRRAPVPSVQGRPGLIPFPSGLFFGNRGLQPVAHPGKEDKAGRDGPGTRARALKGAGACIGGWPRCPASHRSLRQGGRFLPLPGGLPGRPFDGRHLSPFRGRRRGREESGAALSKNP